MSPEVIRKVIGYMEDLVWKIWYYAEDEDALLMSQLQGYSKDQRHRLHNEIRKVSYDYCMRLFRSDTPTYLSVDFHYELAWVFRHISQDGMLFPSGSAPAGLGVVECLLRCEGWEPISDESEVQLKEEVLSLNPADTNFEDRFTDAVRSSWEVTGHIDRSGFRHVDVYRKHKGNRLVNLYT